MHVQICTCAPCELWRPQCVFCYASQHDSCTQQKQTCQTHYKNLDHWHKGDVYTNIWIAAFTRLDSKNNLTFRYAYFQLCDVYMCMHTQVKRKLKKYETFLPLLTFSGCTVTPNSSECGVWPSLLSLLPVSLSLTHFSTCSFRVALVALCGGVR